MTYSPTILIIGERETTGLYVEELSSCWLTQGRRPSAQPDKGGVPLARNEDIIVELCADGSCVVRSGHDRVDLVVWPPPEDLKAIIRVIIRVNELDRQLGVLEEMEPLGVLACTHAHDANNLLVPMLLSLGELAAAEDLSVERRQHAATAERVARKLAALMRRMLSFTRDGAAHATDLNAAVREVLPTLSSLVGPNIQVMPSLSEAAPPVPCDLMAIERILANLCANARDALPLGGTIRIATRTEANSVVLQVQDDGTGMLPETMARAFEPLFTTKPGKGTGLGLSSVRRIVSRARGSIQLESQPGSGTKVTIAWPPAR